MKKTALLSFAIIAVNFAISQSVHIGFKGGLNLSNLTYKSADALDYKVGLHAGVLSHVHISRRFALQPELTYSNQGGERTFNNTDIKQNLNYINIPVLAQYMFGKGFRLETGPQLGFLVGAKQKVGSKETNIKGEFESTDFSWAFGLGYVSRSGLGFDARWLLGVSDINKRATSPATRNNNFQVGIFYMLDPAHNRSAH
jgi:hypothetical protein